MKKLFISTLLLFIFTTSAEEPDDLKNKGVMAFNDNFYSIASNYLSSYLKKIDKKNPEFAEATILLTRSLIQEKKYETATEVLKNYSQALLPLEQNSLQEELDFWTAYIAFIQKKYGQADAGFQAIYKKSDRQSIKAQALSSLAESMFHQKKYRKSKEYYLILVNKFEHTPQGQKATAELVKLFLLERDFFWSQREINRMKNASHQTVKSNAAALEILFYSLKGQKQKALELFHSASKQIWGKKRNNNIYLSLHYLGELLTAQKSYVEAAAVFTTALLYATTSQQTEQSMFKIANAKISDGNIEEAITLLLDYTRSYPESQRLNDVHLLIGSLHKKNKDYSAALQFFSKVVKSKTASNELRFKAQLEIADCFVSVESPDKAITAFLEARKMAESSKDKAKSVFLAAEVAYRSQNYQQAIMYYQLIIEEYADSSYTEHAYFYQGLAYDKEKQYNEAATAFQIFLKTYPSSTLLPAVLFQYAVVLKQQNKNDEAASYFEKLVKLYPNSRNCLKAILLQSDCLTASGKATEAVKLLENALVKYQNAELHPYVYSRFINLLLLIRENKRAIEVAEEFFEKYNKTSLTPEILCRLGDFYKNNKDFVNAAEQYHKLATEFPKDKRAGQAALDSAVSSTQFNIPLAIQKLETIVQNTNRSNTIRSKALFELGTIYSNRADYEKAAKIFADIDNFQDLHPEIMIKAKGRRGDCLFLLGKYQKAADLFSELSINPDIKSYIQDQIRFKLAQSLLQINKTEEAVKILHDIIYQHNSEQTKGKVRDWRYYTRAAFELSDLYTRQGEVDKAIKILQRIKNRPAPISAEARTRIENLQEKQANEQ